MEDIFPLLIYDGSRLSFMVRFEVGVNMDSGMYTLYLTMCTMNHSVYASHDADMLRIMSHVHRQLEIISVWGKTWRFVVDRRHVFKCPYRFKFTHYNTHVKIKKSRI